LVYLFTEIDDNTKSIIDGAVKLSRERPCRFLAVDCDNSRIENKIDAFSGGPPVAAKLSADLESGKGGEGSNSSVELIPFEPTDMIHTLNEAECAVRFAKAAGAAHLTVLAPPFHLPRCFLTTVSVAAREAPGLKVYAVQGSPQPWNEHARHSQGKVVGTRLSFIDGEIDRINRYTTKGDLLPIPAVLEYLKQRDQA